MSDLTIIDTDILIDVGRGDSRAVAFLSGIQSGPVPAISVVTQMELLVGCRNKAELRKLESFLTQFSILEIDREVSLRAVDLLRVYRLSHGLLIADALIAATALVADASFISKNQRDYQFIVGLKLLPYI